MVSPLLGRDPVGVFPVGGRGCDGAEHQSATGKRGLSSLPRYGRCKGLVRAGANQRRRDNTGP